MNTKKLLTVTALSTGLWLTGEAYAEESVPAPVETTAPAPPDPPAPPKRARVKRKARVIVAPAIAAAAGNEMCRVGNTKGPKYDAACVAKLTGEGR